MNKEEKIEKIYLKEENINSDCNLQHVFFANVGLAIMEKRGFAI
jgi:hypothetical protein